MKDVGEAMLRRADVGGVHAAEVLQMERERGLADVVWDSGCVESRTRLGLDLLHAAVL